MSNRAQSTMTRVVVVLGILVLVTAFGFVAHLFLGSDKSSNAQESRKSIVASYDAIVIPTELQLLQHQTTNSGTPSEVYYYSYTGQKNEVSNAFGVNLAAAGYSLTKGTDGLLFSASKAGNISLNFTFTDPNQLKVVAI